MEVDAEVEFGYMGCRDFMDIPDRGSFLAEQDSVRFCHLRVMSTRDPHESNIVAIFALT
ncbi:hypothetical protein SERLA73DRAFT_171218 [Serpula lacrymans var. lacrymans S7.3]|uniref:Uncharacterized protein n=2 Tax=Serpula lacrymans var. lacrymans TaxID=341189 RepID=F8QAN9_SERL3|nr:uncharacterized protein SERLADRAFT_477791 [Serpula lacrymans var. lacrymans S7.9]EGN94829.1 hypothetical protein SERLA73DRAFT_171218 [Serpula lacrymans var. lacrymans S7.3]EGO20330.1 hypothetical protein SERLADRAFT_477791 [Serpula lacrymans var. lacrymans S7.9]